MNTFIFAALTSKNDKRSDGVGKTKSAPEYNNTFAISFAVLEFL